MKILLLLVLVCTSTIGWSQNKDTLSETKPDKVVSRHSENKNIGLSHLTTDIITFSQLAESHELTIENMPEWEIISYDLTYFIPDGNSVIIYVGSGDKIPDTLTQEIIASGSNRILFENIIISRKGESDTAGFRNFYLN
ncbi:hypothetical protein G3O08_17520 [Cryomorpha ignava]|uniref:Uncharacterized protein n=1 Tax=Cryomorpha ignava TaxID=101383 RepID=A0A7K3WUE8_9FLAO|nr:hypothetical protein [Cryomorpha ignava]NEN25299.1 hypothetical protein [Cryomorpha ignava]